LKSKLGYQKEVWLHFYTSLPLVGNHLEKQLFMIRVGRKYFGMLEFEM